MISVGRRKSILLILAIIVIVILVFVGVRYAINFFKQEDIKELQYDILLVKTKTETFKANNVVNPDENPLLGYKLNELPEGINIDGFKAKNIIKEEEYEKYYLLDAECLEKMDLKELVNKHPGYFIVNYETFEVVYTEGYTNKEGVLCYKISDLEKYNKIEEPVNEQLTEETTEEQTEQAE